MKLLYAGAMMLLTLASLGQGTTSKMSVNWSETAKLPKGYLMEELIHADENNIYLRLNGKKNKIIIQRFNASLALQSQTEIEPSSGNVEAIQFTEEALLVYTIDKDVKANKVTLYLEAFNPKSLKTTGKAKKLASFSSSNLKKSQVSFSASSSRDEKRTAAVLTVTEEDKSSSIISMFDESFNELWSIKERLNNNRELENTWISMQVHNSGRLTLLREENSTRGAGKEMIKDGKFPYSFILHNYSDDGTAQPEYVIESDDNRYLKGAKLSVLNDNTVVCGGFFADDPKDSKAKGVYFVRIDGATGEPVGAKYTPFSLDFVKEGATKREASKADKKSKKGDGADIELLKTRRIIAREDGGAVIIGEVEYVQTVMTTDSKGNVRYSYFLVSKDIILANINAEGDLEQEVKVMKNQRLGLSYGLLMNGFGYHVKGDKVHFLFNDHIENLTHTDGPPKSWSNLKKHVAVIVTYNGERLSKREVFGSQSADKVMFQPSASRQIDENRYFIAGQSTSRKARIGIATFK